MTKVNLHHDDCLKVLKKLKDNSIDLILTSPPYQVGKEYEKDISIDEYIKWQDNIIKESIRITKDTGSICWQVGNYIDHVSKEVVPLDILLYPIFKKYNLTLKNRIIWTFEHGLHCSSRLSGRYETILWFIKSENYYFNLDAIRIPQKYPNKKYFKGPKKGELSCNPLGKNPGDVWAISNVKHNHPEKTDHPCQFPESLVERLVLSLTNKNNIVLDPFVGSGTASYVAAKNGRNAIGIDNQIDYINISKTRLELVQNCQVRIIS